MLWKPAMSVELQMISGHTELFSRKEYKVAQNLIRLIYTLNFQFTIWIIWFVNYLCLTSILCKCRCVWARLSASLYAILPVCGGGVIGFGMVCRRYGRTVPLYQCLTVSIGCGVGRFFFGGHGGGVGHCKCLVFLKYLVLQSILSCCIVRRVKVVVPRVDPK
jgi:hypothetical protein